MRTTLMLALVTLTGCYDWGELPVDNTVSYTDARWSPEQAIAAGSHLYVPVGETTWMAFTPGSEGVELELGGTIRNVALTPSEDSVVGFVDITFCEDDTGLSLEDCDDDDIIERTELVRLMDGAITERIDVPTAYNTIEFSDSGNWMLARLDLDGTVSWTGVVDLTAVQLLNLTTEESWEVSVGFAAEATTFSSDEEQLLVLSESEVALIDLTGDAGPERDVTYPLTLDNDDVIEPVGVAIEPSGRYALISVRDSDDLYVLDLDNPSVNLVALASEPTALAVDDEHDRTVVVYSRRAQVDLIEHDYFEVEELDLDEAMTRIEVGDEATLLWDPGASDVYRLAFDDDGDVEVIEYSLRNPATDLLVSPDEALAVVVTRAENASGDLYDQHPGFEVLDLTDDQTYPQMLEDEPQLIELDATVDDSTGEVLDLGLLIKMQGNDRIYRLDLYTGETESIDIDGEVVTMGVLPDGGIWMTLDALLGRIAFYDPETGEITEQTGFVAEGLLDIHDTAEVAP